METFEIKYQREKDVLNKQLLECCDKLEEAKSKQMAHIAILELIFDSPDTETSLQLLEIVINQTKELREVISNIQEKISEIKTAIRSLEEAE